MPIESNKPPDPLFDELCTLTKMTSAEDIRDASLKETKIDFEAAKVSGRVRERVDRSPVDFRGGSGISNEHTSMEDVVNTGVVHENSHDGIACNKGGRGFVFGKNDVSNGILNSPVGPFL
nr:hypothetical protein [Tanacetum cinerariifolium]